MLCILWGHAGQCVGDRIIEFFFGSCPGVAQVFFDLAPHLLDGVEVRGIRRQGQDGRAGGLDMLEGLGVFVRGKIVEDHNVAGAEHWGKDLFGIDTKHFAGCRPVDGHTRGASVDPDGRYHRRGHPMPAGRMVDATCPAARAASKARHVGFGARLIQANEPLDGEGGLRLFPAVACGRYIGAVLFARA